MDPYQIAMIQAETTVVVRPEERDEIVGRNLDRILELLEWVFMRTGRVKLAMTPEYSLMGQYRPRTVEEWLRVALPVPNTFTERAAAKAAELGCYIQLHFLERNDDWPGRYFNTTVIISPEKEIVLTYRKHNGSNNLNTTYTAPSDVRDEYVRRYGEDALFPVVDTPIGRIGVMVCGDILYPEMARVLALKGAEIILHPTAEPFQIETDAWDALRRARAIENVCYFFSCNSGGFLGSNRPRGGYRGRSQAYGPMGERLAIIPESGEAVISAPVDIDRLRLMRTSIGSGGHSQNALAQIRSSLFAREYAKADRWPDNAFLDCPLQSVEDTRKIGAAIIERLVAEGVQKRP